jgi:hypothetical protein
MPKIGTRRKVFNGTAQKTSGGLTKDMLFKGKDGSIKSKSASSVAKKNNNLKKRLVPEGYGRFMPGGMKN